MNTYIYVQSYAPLCLSANTLIYVYLYMYICIHIYIYKIYKNVYTCIHIYIYKYTRIYTNAGARVCALL